MDTTLAAVDVLPSAAKKSLARNIVYWLPTALVVADAILGGLTSVLRVDAAISGVRHLGYPTYFAVMLGVAKLCGALALVAPRVPRTLREWAYAGFVFDALAAAISILAVGDPPSHVAPAALFLALTLWSYRASVKRVAGNGAPGAAAGGFSRQ